MMEIDLQTVRKNVKDYDFCEHAYQNGYKKAEDTYKLNIKNLQSELADCKNELCLKCGNRKKEHLGACNNCRWR